ncbi:MAG: hypothetical protein K6T55_08465 [Syntrophobacterales bacterium]|nr:hypothetical protein [Syntrophobacterales bacterium]
MNARNSRNPASLGRAQMITALLIWLGALAGVILDMPPVRQWLYHLAWWPLLLFLDGLLLLKTGESWLWGRPREFVRAAAFSVTIWLFFELFNLYLLNWRYVGLEPRLWRRWPGYVLAFATVVPAILLTARVTAGWRGFQELKGTPRTWPGWQPAFLILGTVCLTLPFILPTYAFPLLWLGVIFLGDPLLPLVGRPAYTARWLAGDRREVLALLVAGLALGFWWEMWNYPATSRWIYTLPLFNFGRIFEMPVLGYLGFPPFALECAILYTFLEELHARLGGTSRGRRLFWLAQGVWWLVMLAAIDARTVLSFASP